MEDYKLSVEYKHLQSNAPGGVYIVPSLESLRLWEGALFIRRGLYAGGIFKFTVELPDTYNDRDAWPELRFLSRVYNPYVDKDGYLDLRAAYPTWDPTRHYIVTALTFLKKIFYVKNFDDYGDAANPDALHAFVHDKHTYLVEVESCVRDSATAVFENEGGLKFRDADVSGLRDHIWRSAGYKDDDGNQAERLLDEAKSLGDACLEYIAQQTPPLR